MLQQDSINYVGCILFKPWNPKFPGLPLVYVRIGITIWGQKAVCWDSPKPLKVSGVFLTSLRLGDQIQCLMVLSTLLIELVDVFI